MTTVSLINADSLRTPLASRSVHMIATSPPYWGLRDYGLGKWTGGDPECDHVEAEIRTGLGLAELGKQYKGGGKKQGEIEVKQFGRECQKCGAVRSNPGLGLEPLHDCLGWARGENCGECYVCRMRLWAAECWRVLRDDGVMFLNLGDSYASIGHKKSHSGFGTSTLAGGAQKHSPTKRENNGPGLKHKDLTGIPWRVALALQADGWYLRSDIIWAKPNPMPESVTDRPTKAHEYIFLLTKSKKYFYDIDAVREKGPGSNPMFAANGSKSKFLQDDAQWASESNGRLMLETPENGRNRRTVWDIATAPYPGAHFACFPPALVEPMIKAGTSEAGCCSVCAAPFERVVEKETHSLPVEQRTGRHGHNGTPPQQSGWFWTAPDIKREYWQPTCSHDAPAVPCTVLDTFAGSGTTGQVARQLGRRFVGLDLSFDYLKNEARSRLELDRLDEWTNGKAAGADEDIMTLPLFAGMGGG